MKQDILCIQLIVFFLIACCVRAYSQEDGTLDTTFFAMEREAGSGFNWAVEDMALQSDGKTLVAGSFTSFNGESAPHLIRLNQNGTKDYSFNVESGFTSVSGFPGNFSLITFPDDRILVGGEFTHYNGFSAPNMVRLNPDGTADQTFDIGSGFNDAVLSFVLQPDGKILVGGGFTSYRGESAPYLVRLNPDGSKDPTFNVATTIESQVNTLGLQPDGKVLVHAGNGLIRLNADGSFDPSFSLPTPFGEEYLDEDQAPQVKKVDIRAIQVQEDGQILLAGILQTGLKLQLPLVRLNADGSMDSNFQVNEADPSVWYNKIILSPEGKIYAVGMHNWDEAEVIRFNPDGTKDRSFYTRYASESRAVVLQSDGKLIAGLDFYFNQTVIRYNEDGSHDLTYNPLPEFDEKVNVIKVQNDGKIVVGGEFKVYNGQLANGIVRINKDGTLDQTFHSGIGFQHSSVLDLLFQDDGKILVFGRFSMYNNMPVGTLLRLKADGALDESFDIGTGFEFFSERSGALQEDGKILVAGDFSTFNGEPTNKMIRLNTDGTRDSSFNIEENLTIRILTIFPQVNGKIMVGGWIDYVNGNPAHHLIRLNPDGSKDPSFNIGSNFNIDVQTIVVQPDGKILAGGSADTTVPGPRLMRFNTDGTIDPTFNAEIESQSIKSIALQSDGRILLRTDSDDDEKTFIRLNSNGTIDPTFHITERALDGRVFTMALQPDENILLGGIFTSFNDIVTNRIVRLLNPKEEPGSMTEVVRINAGGENFLFNGVQWQADQYFSGGKVYSKTNPIENTENDPLYQSERNGNFTYDIPVPEEGLYMAELHFAEIHWQRADARVFRVAVEGGQPSSAIDLYGDHGGSNNAYVLKLDDIEVADGKLTIELITEKDNAKISGIAVFKKNSFIEPEKLRINSGGGALDFGEEQWLGDQYFTGGRTYSISAGEINNTHRDELYRSERYGDFSYSLPAPDEGLYTVEFHLAEIYWLLPDSRIFDIAVENGQFISKDIDIYSDYGTHNPTVIVAENIKVTDGFLDIEVSTTKDNGKISGIVMYRQSEEVDPHDGFITRINSGGEAIQFAGEEWQADQNYSGGRTYTNASEGIGNTDKDELFYTERYGEFGYDIPVPATGLYTVELHFAEIHWNREGARIFDVDVENGQYALEDLDLYRELGDSHLSTVYVGKDINVADGILNIDFSKVKDNPKVSGIVVYKQSTAGARLQAMDSLSKEAGREESDKLLETLGSEIRLYPNPAKDRVRLEFYAEQTGEWDFVLVNSSGTATHLAQLNLEKGEYLLEFDLSQYSLSAGTYYVQIMNKRGVLTTKRVIIL